MLACKCCGGTTYESEVIGEHKSAVLTIIDEELCAQGFKPTLSNLSVYSKENSIKHKSDCAVHNEPALPKGECDCQDVCPISGEDSCAICHLDCDKDQDYWKKKDEVPVEEATTKELVESGPSIKSMAELWKTPLGKLTEEESKRLSDWISHSEVGGSKTAIAHVYNEKIVDPNRGTLEAVGRIVLESVKFVKYQKDLSYVILSKCDEKGILIPASRQVGIIGIITVDGRYQFKAMQGVGVEDTIFVDYDYEYDLPLDAE